MPKPKRKVQDMIRMRSYYIIARAVEEGIAAGWRHAHKHTDKPQADALKSRIEDEVMAEICNVVDFND